MYKPQLEMTKGFDKKVLIKIANRLNEGKATPEEKAYFEKWYSSHKDDTLELSNSDGDDKEAICNRIHEKILAAKDVAKPSKRLSRTLIKVASVLLILGISSLYFYKKGDYFNTDKSKTITTTSAKIEPGKHAATLTLADGKQIDLGAMEAGHTLQDENVMISKSKDGALQYIAKTTTQNHHITNTVSTSNGQSYKIQLVDGTIVWLNAGSSLTFPLTFENKERKISLVGEAYFEVASNPKAPFRVYSANQTVEVLGTHFNISAYPSEVTTKTTLLEGSVKVKQLQNNIILKVGQQSRTKVGSSDIKVTEVDTEQVVAWKNGYFRFKDEVISSIMLKLSRWYDVDVSFIGQITDEKFNGTISRTKSINEVLEMLETTGAVKFKIDGRRIVVMK